MIKERLPVTGGCLCGAVHYQASQAPFAGYFCHCKMCKKAYGGLSQATVRFHERDLAFTQGIPKYYRSSAFALRSFCVECGSPLTFTYEGNPDVWVLLGSLDHPDEWPFVKDATWGPCKHVYAESKVSWHKIHDELPQQSGEIQAVKDAVKHVAEATHPPHGRP